MNGEGAEIDLQSLLECFDGPSSSEEEEEEPRAEPQAEPRVFAFSDWVEEPAPSQMTAKHRLLPIGELLVDPEDNLSRGGAVLSPNHPDVQQMVATIEAGELIHDVGVRPLPEPLDRRECKHPCCGGIPLHELEKPINLRHESTHHTHRLDLGFSRYVAHRVLGRAWIECKIQPRTDLEAMRAGIVENLNRAPPTDYQIAMALLKVKEKFSWSDAELAKNVGARPYDVETLVRIVERCPKDLLERFRLTPTREVRHALSKISRVKGRTEAETHQLMRADWAAHEAAQARRHAMAQMRAKAMVGRGQSEDGAPIGRPVQALSRPELQSLCQAIADPNVTEWFDPESGMWRPMTADGRACVLSFLRHAISPRVIRRPLRKVT